MACEWFCLPLSDHSGQQKMSRSSNGSVLRHVTVARNAIGRPWSGRPTKNVWARDWHGHGQSQPGRSPGSVRTSNRTTSWAIRCRHREACPGRARWARGVCASLRRPTVRTSDGGRATAGSCRCRPGRWTRWFAWGPGRTGRRRRAELRRLTSGCWRWCSRCVTLWRSAAHNTREHVRWREHSSVAIFFRGIIAR